MRSTKISRILVLCSVLSLLSFPVSAQTSSDAVDQEMIDKIKKEGMEGSQIMETISYLTDVHGPRVTGSPNTRVAAEWTLGRLEKWGIENGHTESWGPFGRGWTLESCIVNLVEPTYAPIIAHVKAWSPSTTRSVRGVPIYLDVQTAEDLEKYRGKLGRAIVLISPPRELEALFDPPASRKSEEQLLRLANARPPTTGGSRSGGSFRRPNSTPPSSSSNAPTSESAAESSAAPPPSPTAGERPPSPDSPPAQAPQQQQRQPEAGPATPSRDPRVLARLLADKWQLAYTEGAAVILEPGRGDGGNVFVSSVTMPRLSDDAGAQGNPFSRGPRPWATDATEIIPQAVVAAEHYNRLVRMLQLGAEPKVEVDILCRYHNDDPNSFNIIAEILGTDLKDEVVMLGGHFDSWQSGTGATDNAVGCGVAMEAIRILQAIDAKPRRTIRLALWTGEEQGLLGSRAYVEQHFGKMVFESSEGEQSEDATNRQRPTPKYQLKPEQLRISAYYNLDNGTGRIRGIYLQGNEQLRAIFRTWLEPFEEMDAATISAGNTGGTDHQSFDAVGIPGFQFIQDAVEYDTRTHHSSMDVFDRIQEEDVKQASIIMASFVYHTAMRDEKLPRKPLNAPIEMVVEQPTPIETTEPAAEVTAAGASSE